MTKKINYLAIKTVSAKDDNSWFVEYTQRPLRQDDYIITLTEGLSKNEEGEEVDHPIVLCSDKIVDTLVRRNIPFKAIDQYDTSSSK